MLCLDQEHESVFTVLTEQIGVRTIFNDATLVEEVNAIHHLDG